jgi:hypothetical protein
MTEHVNNYRFIVMRKENKISKFPIINQTPKVTYNFPFFHSVL